MKTMLKAIACAAVLAAALAGCQATPDTPPASDGGPAASEPAPVKIVEGTPVLFFFADDATTQLRSDMEAGKLPTACRTMYDESGARPEVVVTDPETIQELYDRLSRMIVLEESGLGITDSYHYIFFTLADGTEAGFSFEGAGLITRSQESWAVSDEGNLWGLVRELQDEMMEN